jgi:23S rRNA pseudouridine1911/1915/1917 synthase
LKPQISWKVNLTFDQKSLRSFLEYFHLSKSNIYKLESQKKVFVNHQFYTFDHTLSKNDQITIDLADFKEDTTIGHCGDFEIVYEDDDFLVVNKKPFLLVHSDGTDVDSLSNHVKYHYEQLGYLYPVLPVHRIDYETSGIVIFAKHLLSLSYMSSVFSNHQIKKQYVALCANAFKQKRGLIDTRIGGDRHSNKQVVTKTGKEATTLYKVIEEANDIFRVEIEIKGGRKHQIRVHLSSIGHPIIGDQLYGGRKDKRMMLHFKKASFIHPRTQEEITLICNEPF